MSETRAEERRLAPQLWELARRFEKAYRSGNVLSVAGFLQDYRRLEAQLPPQNPPEE